MKILVKGQLLDLIEKEYEFEGKNGVSYQLVIYSNGELLKVKVNNEIFDLYKYSLGQEIEILCDIFIKGSYSLSFKG